MKIIFACLWYYFFCKPIYFFILTMVEIVKTCTAFIIHIVCLQLLCTPFSALDFVPYKYHTAILHNLTDDIDWGWFLDFYLKWVIFLSHLSRLALILHFPNRNNCNPAINLIRCAHLSKSSCPNYNVSTWYAHWWL